jgi:hypothetical protein
MSQQQQSADRVSTWDVIPEKDTAGSALQQHADIASRPTDEDIVLQQNIIR